MKKIFFAMSFAILSVAAITVGCKKDAVKPFILKSTELSTSMTQAQYANAFGGCTGENKSPQLTWENPPAKAKSFAITIFDKDANAGAGFNHWLVFDISATTLSLSQDAGNFSGANIPKGAIQSQTDAMLAGYVGVCPPAKETHHYEITVYAIYTSTLGLTSKATPAEVKSALATKSLGKTSMVVTASN